MLPSTALLIRSCGDLIHVVSIWFLLHRLMVVQNAQGVSRKTQELLLVVYACRYTDLFTMHYGLYNCFFKVYFICTSTWIVLLLSPVWSSSSSSSSQLPTTTAATTTTKEYSSSSLSSLVLYLSSLSSWSASSLSATGKGAVGGVMAHLVSWTAKVRQTYRSEQEDSLIRHWTRIALPCFLLASLLVFVETWTFPQRYQTGMIHFLVHFCMEVLLDFSLLLESVAILPQIILFQRYRQVESLTGGAYIFLFGVYRLLYVGHWVYRAGTEGYESIQQSWLRHASGMVHVTLCFWGLFGRPLVEPYNSSSSSTTTTTTAAAAAPILPQLQSLLSELRSREFWSVILGSLACSLIMTVVVLHPIAVLVILMIAIVLILLAALAWGRWCRAHHPNPQGTATEATTAVVGIRGQSASSPQQQQQQQQQHSHDQIDEAIPESIFLLSSLEDDDEGNSSADNASSSILQQQQQQQQQQTAPETKAMTAETADGRIGATRRMAEYPKGRMPSTTVVDSTIADNNNNNNNSGEHPNEIVEVAMAFLQSNDDDDDDDNEDMDMIAVAATSSTSILSSSPEQLVPSPPQPLSTATVLSFLQSDNWFSDGFGATSGGSSGSKIRTLTATKQDRTVAAATSAATTTTTEAMMTKQEEEPLPHTSTAFAASSGNRNSSSSSSISYKNHSA